ncbi:MAG: HAMP domain-containing protein, partial [Georgfuchsia sp.]
MFKNMKIGARLGMGFGLVQLLLVAIAILSYMRVAQINEEIKNLVNDKYPKVTMATDLIRAMDEVEKFNRNTMLIYDAAGLEKQYAGRKNAINIIDETHKKLEAMIASEEGKKLNADIKVAETNYWAMLKKFDETNKTLGGNYASEILYGEFVPVANAYLNSVRALIKHEDQSMVQSGKFADELAHATENLILILSVIAFLAAAVIGWWVTRSITAPTRHLIVAADKMAEGDFNFKVDIDSNDEVGTLARSVAGMQSNVQTIIAEMNHMSKEHDAGDIDVKIDEGKFKNDFQVMAGGVNNMVSGHIA